MNIFEDVRQARDQNDTVIQCLFPAQTEVVDWSAASAQATTLWVSWVLKWKVLRVCASWWTIYLKFGWYPSNSPTATAADMAIPQWAIEYFSIRPLRDEKWNYVKDSDWNWIYPKVAVFWAIAHLTLMI